MSFSHSGRMTLSINGVEISDHVMDVTIDDEPPQDRQGLPVTNLPGPPQEVPEDFPRFPLAPRVVEKREQDPCEHGHFYEEYRCVYCDVQFCATEHGGHSFETGSNLPGLGGGITHYDDGKSPADCWHCHRKIVNLRKGPKRKASL